MTPKKQPMDKFELFRSHFDQQLNPQHPLILLAKQIDWPRFDTAFAGCYSPDMGAPGKAIRLMVGLHYLKHTFNESDESLLARWVENPYWQYFCGFTHMQHDMPLHPTAMVKWRQRVGNEKLAELLRATIDMARDGGHISDHELSHVSVDTTVQEKNITHPTDSKLLLRAIQKLSAEARACHVPLRQSYLRVAKRAAIKASRYAHAKQFRRMRREIRFLRTRLGRLVRDIERKVPQPSGELATLLDKSRTLQGQARSSRGKLYSLHEPEVCCISKGKARKRYEFGQKIALALTNRGNWFVAAELMAGNPYDGHTLAATIDATERNTGVAVQHAYVDKGYRGHDYEGSAIVDIVGTGGKRLTRTQRQRRKRRSAIEPKIGHNKSDHRMERCFLKGLDGDAINATLAAAGANLAKLLRLLHFALSKWAKKLARLGKLIVQRLIIIAMRPSQAVPVAG